MSSGLPPKINTYVHLEISIIQIQSSHQIPWKKNFFTKADWTDSSYVEGPKRWKTWNTRAMKGRNHGTTRDICGHKNSKAAAVFTEFILSCFSEILPKWLELQGAELQIFVQI